MVTYVDGKLLDAGWRKSRGDETLWTRTGSEFTREEAIVEVLEAENRAAYERGLRRGMAIARGAEMADGSIDWYRVREQMEREIEEAKR